MPTNDCSSIPGQCRHKQQLPDDAGAVMSNCRRLLHRIDWLNVTFWSAAFLSGFLLLGGLGFIIHHAVFIPLLHP